MNSFEVITQDGFARCGKLKLAHGTVDTPVFMPVGTHGAVKAVSSEELKDAGSQIILGNTYHLNLRPGMPLLKKMGGLHSFMQWDRPILTDSGGFQVFSLGKLKSVTDEGVVFRSHLNGDLINFTPELAAEIQQVIGSDIAMILDECLALPNTEEALALAVRRSIAWTKRFLMVPRKEGQKIFGIIQGGTSVNMRLWSLSETVVLPLDGIAIGGLSVGEPHEAMVEVLQGLAPYLPAHLPHYLMGVGTPLDLLEGVANGIDMFDCVLPTRNGRNGGFFTDDGLLNIRNAVHTQDESPVVKDCECPCCSRYSRAYLRHLFLTKEILGCRLATLHNLHYYHRFVSRMREAIRLGQFTDFYLKSKARLTPAYNGKISQVEEHV